MEVLHDQLLALFSDNPALQPQDIVVMMPDVATYAPFIEAVFDTPEIQNQRIPYSIADRTARVENGIIDTFLSILELAGSRFGASSLLNILESTAVQGRFNLAPADLETIRVWIDIAAFVGASTRPIEKSLGCPLLPRTPGEKDLIDCYWAMRCLAATVSFSKTSCPAMKSKAVSPKHLGISLNSPAAFLRPLQELETARTLAEVASHAAGGGGPLF